MVQSLDGFIAKPDDDISWMQSQDHFEGGKELTEDDVNQFLDSIDCYIMGSNTFEHALQLGWPYGDKPVVVVTSRQLTTDKDSVTFFSGDINSLINTELKPKFENIWMVGGAALTKEFIKQDLADKLVVTILPVLLGNGLPFFDQIGVERILHLEESTTYSDGMVELTYEIKESNG